MDLSNSELGSASENGSLTSDSSGSIAESIGSRNEADRPLKRIRIVRGGGGGGQEDRLSALDDKILIHILSFLWTEDAVKTSVLSKRWLYLWTLVPCLKFDCPPNLPSVDDFCSFVDQVLIFHRSPTIKVFELYYGFSGHYPPKMDLWMRFASLRNVEQLTIFIWDPCGKRYHPMPQFLFSCSTLKALWLSSSDMQWHGKKINWPSLEKLELGDCIIRQDLVDHMLSDTPLLKHLRFLCCYGFQNLHITNPTCKELLITDDDPTLIDTLLNIDAPYIHTLNITGSYVRHIQLLNLSSLVSAKIDFVEASCHQKTDRNSEEKSMIRKMLEKVSNVTELTLGGWCFWYLPKLDAKKFSMPSLKCKRLALNIILTFHDFPRIAALLHSACGLEELTIDMISTEYPLRPNKSAAQKDYWTSLSAKNFSCLGSRLRVVKIMHRRDKPFEEEPLVSFVQFLLKEACVLEKMIFEQPYGVAKKMTSAMQHRSLQLATKLLSIPRSSINAVIQFS